MLRSSFLKAIFSVVLVVTVSACGKASDPKAQVQVDPNRPNDEVTKAYLSKVVNDFYLYRVYFEEVGFERVNGWAEGENYKVKANVKLRAKAHYGRIVEDVASSTLDRLAESRFPKQDQQSLAFSRNFYSEEYLERLRDYLNHPDTFTPAFRARLQALKEPLRTDLQFDAYDTVRSSYGKIITSSLRKGDEIVRIYELSFRKTENGWEGFYAQ